MPIQAIIFDIDGLMLDTEPISKRSWATVMSPAGFPLTDDVYQQMIGRTEADVRHMLADIYGDHFPFERMYQEREQRFNELVQQEGIPLKPGLLDLLAYVSKAGLKKAVASSTYAKLAEVKLSIAGIRHQLGELQVEHRDLDLVIAHLIENPPPDELLVRRLKKRKLLLKDRILQLERLLARAADGVVREVILATNYTNEGEATAHYLAERLAAAGLSVSRIARGVPVGGELEFVDSGTLAQAVRERRAVS